ncbi:MAG: hydroxymethylbilane synthase [Alicyclobacillus sp.]|nr:hydroxymethylbilane synthase [Alicyclobacillus sp.]
MTTIRVASRQSQLALAQTKWVIDAVRHVRPEWQFEIVPVVTQGDKVLDVALSKVGGKGLFVSEVEAALLDGRADFAVHSLKDVPAELADGLCLAAMPKREDPRDAWISRDGRTLEEMPRAVRVGTSSLRRVAQLRHVRPDLQVLPLRGNIDTRLRKLETEGLDAIVLAAAGLHRMGWTDRITAYLDIDVCLPAIGQGVLGIECRTDDAMLRDALEAISDPATVKAATAERALLAELNGGCQVPIAGYATVLPSGDVSLTGLVAEENGEHVVTTTMIDADPSALGQAVAKRLMSMGADRMLAAVNPEC